MSAVTAPVWQVGDEIGFHPTARRTPQVVKPCSVAHHDLWARGAVVWGCVLCMESLRDARS